jgi:diguanylate cyclase (GGDEF)-like protein
MQWPHSTERIVHESPSFGPPVKRVFHLAFQNLLVGLAYWAVATLVQWYFHRYQMWPAPLWLPSGISMYAALWIGRWSWPGIFLGALATNAIGFSQPLFVSTIVSLGNTAAAVVTAELMRKHLGKENPFSLVSEALVFGAGAIILGGISALVGATSVWALRGEPFHTLPTLWLDWCLSDAGAVFLVTPLLLLKPQRYRGALQICERPGEFFVTMVTVISTVVYLLTSDNSGGGAAFLVLVPLLWLAIRFTVSVAYPVLVTSIAVIVAATLAGHGPFSLSEHGGPIFVFAQMCVGFSTSVLLLGGAASEQRNAETALRELNNELENKITERTSQLLASQAQLEKAALYDALTGLANRRLLEDRFDLCEATAHRKKRQFSILLLDLDHFKQINDNFGHHAGDAVLVETACRLSASVRECDVVARMGGDEFIVLLPETGARSDIDTVGQRIVNAMSTPFVFEGRTLTLSTSIGAAVFPDHGESWNLVYRAADIALYDVKRSIRGTWKLCDQPSAASLA